MMRLLADITFISGAGVVAYSLLRDRHRYRAVLGFVAGLALIAAALAAGATSARAQTIVHPDPAPHAHLYQRWVNKSLMPTPDKVVRIHAGMSRCGQWRSAFGCSSLEEDWIAVRPLAKRRRWNERMTLWHELGHIFDRTYYTVENRRWLGNLLGYRGRAWDEEITGTRAMNNRVVPEEAAADLYMFCSNYPAKAIRYLGGDDLGYGWWPARKILRGCGYMRRAYQRGPVQ